MLSIHVDPQIKGLIFDCDGTLADTMALHWDAWQETLAEYGRSCPQTFLDQYKGVPTIQIVAAINQTFGFGLDPIQFSQEKEARLLKKLPQTKPIQPVVDVAHRFKGKLPMAVASGGEQESVSITLTAIGLDDFFDTVLTAADDVKPKPAPDIFLEAARRLQVDPADCLVFEDGDAGIAAAKACGMHVIDVRPLVNSDQ